MEATEVRDLVSELFSQLAYEQANLRRPGPITRVAEVGSDRLEVRFDDGTRATITVTVQEATS